MDTAENLLELIGPPAVHLLRVTARDGLCSGPDHACAVLRVVGDPLSPLRQRLLRCAEELRAEGMEVWIEGGTWNVTTKEATV